jgi:RNA-directed DNA polymerase
MFMAKIGHFQCASIPKRGQVFGKKRIEQWIRKDYKNCRYYYKCDIKKYYPSVNIDSLKKFLRRDIKCEDILYIINFLLGTYKDGLCIGSYLSQYLANYYISYAYHHITENSYSFRAKKNGEKVRINNASHVLFYMDDIIIFSSSVKLLDRVVRDFTHYIHDVLFLKIKEGDGVFRTRTTKVDMMGYCVSIKNTIIRPRLRKFVGYFYE